MELKTTRRNGTLYKDRRLSDTVDLFKPHHAMSAKKYAELMDMDFTHASEFLTRIEKLGVIYIRYSRHNEYFYSLRTDDEL